MVVFVSMEVEKLISDVRLSSVTTASITGDDKVHEFTSMDLVMKLHYIKGLYFFKSDAVEGLSILDIKKPMFRFLEVCYQTSGRIRRWDEGGRPYIKCNDSGVRIVEAKCVSKTIDEWLAMKDVSSLNEQLVYEQVLGPDLGFAPLVFLQFTWFKCGGVSVGLSWAHVLGDIFKASDFINMWGQSMAGTQAQLLSPLFADNPRTSTNPLSSTPAKLPSSLKRVEPVGDHWHLTTSNTCKMQSHSFHFTQKHINQLSSGSTKVKPFHVISARIWKILAKLRSSQPPNIITICRHRGDNSCNSQCISIVEANVSVSEANISNLTNLIAEKGVDETRDIEEVVEKENGKSDYFVYGANLTFVDLEEANIYGLELRGKKPIFATYNIGGVGEEGLVMVLPAPGILNGKEGGRIVNLVLPEDQIAGLKNMLKEELGVFPD